MEDLVSKKGWAELWDLVPGSGCRGGARGSFSHFPAACTGDVAVPGCPGLLPHGTLLWT